MSEDHADAYESPQMDIDCWTFLAKHITLKGVLIFSTEDFEEVMQMMAEGASATKPPTPPSHIPHFQSPCLLSVYSRLSNTLDTHPAHPRRFLTN